MYLEFVGVVIIMAFSVVLLSIGFWKKSGIMVLIGGLFFMGMAVLIDGISQQAWSETQRIELCEPSETVPGADLFTELYTTNSGWTQVSTQITVDSGSADELHFNAAQDGTDRRVHKSMGVSLTGAFGLDFEVDITAKNLPTHFPVLVSSSTLVPRTGAQDLLGVAYGSSAYGGGSDGFLIVSKDTDDAIITIHHSTNIVAGTGTYYITLERQSDTVVVLSVYSDSDRTVHVSGSPQIAGITSEITGFANVQHSVDSGSANTRTLTMTGDNLVVYSLAEGGDSEVCTTSIEGEWQDSNVEIPSTLRFLFAFGSIIVMALGVVRYGFTI